MDNRGGQGVHLREITIDRGGRQAGMTDGMQESEAGGIGMWRGYLNAATEGGGHSKATYAEEPEIDGRREGEDTRCHGRRERGWGNVLRWKQKGRTHGCRYHETLVEPRQDSNSNGRGYARDSYGVVQSPKTGDRQSRADSED